MFAKTVCSKPIYSELGVFQRVSPPYKKEVAQTYWPAFLDRLSEDNYNKPVTIFVSDIDDNDIQIIERTNLDSVQYDRSAAGARINVAVDRDWSTHSLSTYPHVVSEPRKIEVFYERGNQIFAVAITDSKRRRTTIYLEEETPAGSQLELVRSPSSDLALEEQLLDQVAVLVS